MTNEPMEEAQGTANGAEEAAPAPEAQPEPTPEEPKVEEEAAA